MREYVCNEIEKSLFEQKYAVHIVFNKNKLAHSKPIFENVNTSNAYQISIYQHLKFIHTFINNQISSIFSDLIK